MQNQVSYFSVTPAVVRYDESLIPNAKLLYGEISALCNEKGYCWASNDYFAALYKKNTTTISEWISQLVKGGYIRTEGTASQRKIFLSIASGKAEATFGKSRSSPSGKAEDTNNTLNSTHEYSRASSDLFDIFWSEYPKRKRDRDLCKKKFCSFPAAIQKEIVEDVKTRKVKHTDWVKENGRFVCAPIVYLRGQRWEEEIDSTGLQKISNVHHNEPAGGKSAAAKLRDKMKKDHD